MMDLTQQSVLSYLIADGGKVKKSDLVGEFKGSVDCVDPAQKERNRELFRTFVNNVAFVKEIDGVRYVVLKKTYRHLLEGVQTEEGRVEKRGNKEIPLTGERQRPPARSEEAENSEDSVGGGSAVPVEEEGRECSPFQRALLGSDYGDIKVKRMLNFEILKQDTNGDNRSGRGAAFSTEAPPVQSKPFALPLRMPPGAVAVKSRKLKVDPDEPPESPKLDSFRSKRRQPSAETGGGGGGSPQPRRSVKTTKASEEPGETNIPAAVPLEQAEHQWLVKCAAGHWSQVYGLLLGDSQLAEKRDFMSGFTALHWAAKCGNSEMLVKIVDRSREGGVDVDVNAKTHGGYTPLHIAALHDQEYIMAMLVREFGANVSIRDNCGKKAYHYLHKAVSQTLREILGEPKVRRAQDKAPPEKEEPDVFPDLPRGLHSISRLFQPNVTGHKKKHKQRPGLFSLSDEAGEERGDRSDAFM
ncbi:LOW QUALITY PROTEIN: ankyrin repeat domain-containing protein SOWAHA [Embiotoca jacksoni]|uniref:LOW QUALITY PROTEIN: ankyrin repeat domain-containing protein SOWAHA n=1 Tax=Embiotoca jacksoni TaxID=100190 RepID=UPI003703E719